MPIADGEVHVYRMQYRATPPESLLVERVRP
jgi:hypothetical protein